LGAERDARSRIACVAGSKGVAANRLDPLLHFRHSRFGH
jgi:hypothetical protein